MAAPVLNRCQESCVVSFEPSPQTLKYLERTVALSPYAKRWKAIGKALCETAGPVDFFEAAPEMGAYNGLADTSRGGASHRVVVTASTLDSEWMKLGKPQISAIKIDVEGAELRVLQGASECIGSQHPPILLEWSKKNLGAHGVSPDAILDFARQKDYSLHVMPNLARITAAGELALHMMATESFLLWPATAKANAH
jgi:FkbM family methyltransferase